MFKVFNPIVACLTGEFAFLLRMERTSERTYERPRRDRRPRLPVEPIPRAGMRAVVRGPR